MAVEISKLLQGMVLFIDGQSHHEVMTLEMSKVLQGMGDLYTDECHHETFHHGRRLLDPDSLSTFAKLSRN